MSDDVKEEEVGLEEMGCADLNDQVLSCYFTHKDWRKCRQEIEAFKACYEAYQKKKEK